MVSRLEGEYDVVSASCEHSSVIVIRVFLRHRLLIFFGVVRPSFVVAFVFVFVDAEKR